jgi:CheY-like chemotaxis protein
LETPGSNNFLIVENDPNDAFLIKRALAQSECGQSFVCRNPSEAKSYLRGAGMYGNRAVYPMPQVVITDLRMGGESGIELAEWIRKQSPPISGLTIVILTGSASELQWDAALKVGAQRLYRKPTRLEDLEKLLADIATEFCLKSDGSGTV